MLELTYIAVGFVILCLAILLIWKNFVDAYTNFNLFKKGSIDHHNKLEKELATAKMKAEMNKKDIENWDLHQREMNKKVQELANEMRKYKALFNMIYQKEANKLNA